MATDLSTILKLEVPVIVQIGERAMNMDEILSLGPGTIIELEKPVEEELSLRINNKSIGSGTAVKVAENFGLKITGIQPPRQRITAMANEDE